MPKPNILNNYSFRILHSFDANTMDQLAAIRKAAQLKWEEEEAKREADAAHEACRQSTNESDRHLHGTPGTRSLADGLKAVDIDVDKPASLLSTATGSSSIPQATNDAPVDLDPFCDQRDIPSHDEVWASHNPEIPQFSTPDIKPAPNPYFEQLLRSDSFDSIPGMDERPRDKGWWGSIMFVHVGPVHTTESLKNVRLKGYNASALRLHLKFKDR